MDVASLLISQAQHLGADMREHDSQLMQAQQMQESAKKSLREFEKNEQKDYKAVVEAGLALSSWWVSSCLPMSDVEVSF